MKINKSYSERHLHDFVYDLVNCCDIHNPKFLFAREDLLHNLFKGWADIHSGKINIQLVKNILSYRDEIKDIIDNLPVIEIEIDKLGDQEYRSFLFVIDFLAYCNQLLWYYKPDCEGIDLDQFAVLFDDCLSLALRDNPGITVDFN